MRRRSSGSARYSRSVHGPTWSSRPAWAGDDIRSSPPCVLGQHHGPMLPGSTDSSHRACCVVAITRSCWLQSAQLRGRSRALRVRPMTVTIGGLLARHCTNTFLGERYRRIAGAAAKREPSSRSAGPSWSSSGTFLIGNCKSFVNVDPNRVGLGREVNRLPPRPVGRGFPVSVRRVDEQSVLPACPEGMQMFTAGTSSPNSTWRATTSLTARDQQSPTVTDRCLSRYLELGAILDINRF